MSVCTFFGHHDCPDEIQPELRKILIELIENHSADEFYVGNQGAFDRIVRSILRDLKTIYPKIRYSVVLAYMPQKQDEFDVRDFSDTMLPEGIEEIPPRFAISWRNKWMLRRADVLIVYVRRSWGGAAQFAELAERQKKVIIRL